MFTANDLMTNVEDDTEIKKVKKLEFDSKDYVAALEVEDTNPQAAAKLFLEIIKRAETDTTELRAAEASVFKLGKLYSRLNQLSDLQALFTTLRPFFVQIPKAKTAKIIRTLIDDIASTEGATVEIQLGIVNDAIKWCKAEKRTFLQQRMEARLASLLQEGGQFKEALELISKLVREVKKFDDKLLMCDICITESKIHLFLENLPKAKGALTTARAASNAIYCPPRLQAEIDLMAGILCAAESDFKTAYSYFYEAFEGYNTIDSPKQALLCMKYMLLGKIMVNKPADVYTIINGKAGVKFAGPEVTAMKAVADAYKNRSLQEFNVAFTKYEAELSGDRIISSHLSELKNNLLEQNLLRLIEPFSKVELAHVAELIDLPLPFVEAKLGEMVLDKKFVGILDQGSGVLIVYDSSEEDETYNTALKTVGELGNVVDRLYGKAKNLRN